MRVKYEFCRTPFRQFVAGLIVAYMLVAALSTVCGYNYPWLVPIQMFFAAWWSREALGADPFPFRFLVLSRF